MKHTLIEITCPECRKAIEVSSRIKWVIMDERDDARKQTLEEVLKIYKRFRKVGSLEEITEYIDEFDSDDYQEKLEQELKKVSK